MFTGLITDVGVISEVIDHGDKTFKIKTHYPINDIIIGESIACSGVCLTVTEKAEDLLSFDVSKETLDKSTAAYWKVGTKINLERALLAQDRMGGHYVSGHVDIIAEVIHIKEEAHSWELYIQPPKDFIPYLAPKGSVTIDGVSLTINHTTDTCFHLMIIPHTLEKTIINDYHIGQKVNLEIDMLARYMGHYLETVQKHAG